jgi:hypothetical protein
LYNNNRTAAATTEQQQQQQQQLESVFASLHSFLPSQPSSH